MTEPLRLPDPPLRGPRIVLRAWTDGDLPAVAEAATDPYIPLITTVPAEYTDAEGRAWVARQAGRLADREGWPFAIADAASGEAMGLIGLWLRGHGVGELGYWLAGSARGRGMAAEAVRVVTRWALAEAGFGRVQLTAEPWNVASIRTAERAGFVREGLLRSSAVYGGTRRDLIMFSRLPSDPEPAASIH